MITEIRKKTGISQYQLALYLGVSRSLINLVERGDRDLHGLASEKLTFLYIQLLETEKQQKESKNNSDPSPSPAWMDEQVIFHKNKIRDYTLKILQLEKRIKKTNVQFVKNETKLNLLSNAESMKGKLSRKNSADDLWFTFLTAKANQQKKLSGMDTTQSLEMEKKMFEGYKEVHVKLLKDINALKVGK